MVKDSRHPAKPRFASDVDTKKVGTVRRTSSVSKDKEDFREKSSKNLWLILPILILVNNIFVLYRNITYNFFSQDEFQHVHNAWNQFNGLMIYRDFFDHHGPIYTLLNSFILTKINEPASFETLIIFRHYSFFTSLLIFILVFLIAKFFLKTNSLALLTTMVVTMWHITQVASIEIRPDLLQTVFALLGFYLFVINQKTTKVLVFVLSGCLFGLMLCCNFKSIILLAAIFIFLAYEYYKEKQPRSLMIGLLMLLGALFVYAMFGIYFYSQGALNEFLYYNTVFNFSFSTNRSYDYIGMQLTSTNFLKDFLLCLFSILGIY
ncbi:MAG: glycosyltransferase family 39 protein, partial [Cyanobacteria bacterium]|nr:glycosyltransferase family 39 protein [Cyanobacteriota bacterium]